MELSLSENEVHNINDFFDYLSSKILFDGSLPHELQDKLTAYLNDLKSKNSHTLGKITISEANKVAQDKLITLKALAESTVSDNLSDNYGAGDKLLRQIVNSAHGLLVDLKKLGGDSLADVLSTKEVTVTTSPTEDITTFADTCQNFIKERVSGNNWEAKTQGAYESTFSVFEQLMGNKPIDAIKTQECRDFKSMIQRIPKNHSKISAYKNKPLQQLIKQQISQDKCISTESVNKHIQRISSLLNWCVQQGYMGSNPMTGMVIKVNKAKTDSRQPFSIADLNNLFDDPIYTSGKHKHSYYFWLPLIALYTGARIQEICQLELTDIYDVNDVLIFNINDDSPSKRLKNNSSKRLIPVHNDLITLGLTQLIGRRKRLKSKQLFPELHTHASGREGQSQPASKWFARYKSKHGFKQDGIKAFHSFRHTFINELKHISTPEHITAGLAGHTHEAITYGTYGGENSAALLNQHLQKIEYRGFDLSSIKWHPS